MMETTKTQTLPIGYWLKEADRLLTEQINQAQAANGVTRTEWQVLNLLAENGRTAITHLFATMQTFLAEPELQAILNRLSEQGWIAAGDDGRDWQLTEAGQHQHGRIFTTQKEVRQRAMQGISTDDYATTIRVLQQMVNNLDQSGKIGQSASH
ncbi:MAG: hypothetical protein IPM53_07760 [Anaerolineaceae bacterium]|nr:hypothetical protein [Anaerolineaceae bacterium]